MTRSIGSAGSARWAQRTADVGRHLADLANDTYEGAADRDAREGVFREAVRLLDPVVRDVLEEVGLAYVTDPDPVTFEIASDETAGLAATWSLAWPAQREARRRSKLEGPQEVPPLRISAIFPPGWTHGHLRGDHVGHWPLQVTTSVDAARQYDVIWAIAEAELHEWIYSAEEPWARLQSVDTLAAVARATPGGQLIWRLRAGRSVDGIFLRGTHAEASLEAVTAAGLDFVVIDREHGTPSTDAELVSALEIAHLRSVAALVRIPAPLPHLASQVLDQGAAGVVVPQCRSKAEVDAIVDACFLPPLGSRGFSPRTRAASRAREALGSPTLTQVVSFINQSTVVVVQVETPELMESLDKVVADRRVTALLLGAHDLAVATGDADAHVTEDASARLSAATVSEPLAWGRVVGKGEADSAREAGARLLIHGSEAALVSAAIAGITVEGTET